MRIRKINTAKIHLHAIFFPRCGQDKARQFCMAEIKNHWMKETEYLLIFLFIVSPNF